jgi:hypothetical protein
MAAGGPPVAPRVVRLGDVDVVFPSPQLQPIPDSSPLLGAGDGGAALRAALAADGFLYLVGALDRDHVLAAREVVVRHLRDKGDVLAGDEEGRCVAAGCVEERMGSHD